MTSERRVFFATCAPGLEPVLHAEMSELRLPRVERQVGGVHFEGTLADAWRANLELRTAGRVLMRLARFEAKDADGLYAGASTVDWRRFLGPGGSLRVEARSNQSALDHTLFVEQRVKDAIVDELRSGDERPSVERDDVDLRVHVHLFRDRCTLLADTSGEPLYKRGWRKFQGKAPLAETLAAGILRLSGWDRRSPLVDPFCGSATLLIEAALWASDTAPGIFRVRSGKGFGFERWPGHPADQFAALVRGAELRAEFPAKLILQGFDADFVAIEGVSENLVSAGLLESVRIEAAKAEYFTPRIGWNAWIVTNPPYGERVGDVPRLTELYRSFGKTLSDQCVGYHLALLSGNKRLANAMGLGPVDRVRLANGAIECELLLKEL